jgi:hypothetical protein
MEKRTPAGVLLCGALGLVISGGASAAAFDEAVEGDFSNDGTVPTVIDLGVGVHTISGSTVSDPLDRDYFTISVGPGETLNSLVLTAMTDDPPDNLSFIALDDGGAFESDTDVSTMLAASLIGTVDIGSDVLVLLQTPIYGGQGFTAPLGEGEYTIWWQETGGSTSYTFTATIVPEPGSAALLLIAAGGMIRRRRR